MNLRPPMLIGALALSGMTVSSGAQANQSPKPSLRALCNVVGNGEEEDADSPNYFVYQTIILEAAEVSPADRPEDVRRKVTDLWSREIGKLYCSNINFEGGSLLKYAVYNRFDAFIDEVSTSWRVPAQLLSAPDPRDGRTVLDYAEDEAAVAASPAIRQQLERYVVKFVAAGAKHRVELDGIECRQKGGFNPDARCGR